MNRLEGSFDPDAIDEWAKKLSTFMLRLMGFENALGHELNRLGDTFEGEEYNRFYDAFRETRQSLQTFIHESANVVPRLHKDSDLIRAAKRLNPDA